MNLPAKSETPEKIEVTEILDAVRIPVIRIVNPFDPRDRIEESLEWAPAKPLSAYFPHGTAEFVVSINGRIIEREDFEATYLDRTDNLVICPVPQGGDDGKSILRMVAMIAISVVAPQIAGSLYTAMGGTFVAANAGAVLGVMTAGVTMAGSMLVNSVLAPPKPKAAPSGDNGMGEATYGIDGAKNTSLEGIPVPVCYGTFRTAGNILDTYVVNSGDTQILHMRVAVGEGPMVEEIEAIQIDGNPISNYSGVEVEFRPGSDDQAVMSWFGDSVIPVNVGKKIVSDTALLHTTTRAVDQIRVDVVAPTGLFGVAKSDGSQYGVAVDLEILYRPQGSSTWKPLSIAAEIIGWERAYVGSYAYHPPVGARTATYNGEVYIITRVGREEIWKRAPRTPVWHKYSNNQVITDPEALAYLNGNPERDSITYTGFKGEIQVTVVYKYPIYSTTPRISDNKRTAVRRSFASPTLARGVYELAIKRITPKSGDSAVSDEVYVSDVNEILLADTAMPHTAMLAIKVPLSEQLTGRPQVTYVQKGRKILRYVDVDGQRQWVEGQSANPAYIVLDMLTNRRFGGGMSTSRIDMTALVRWADYCDQEGLEFHGVFESEMNLWDALQIVLRIGRAQIVNVGTRVSFVVEKPDLPVMMFSVANMVENTFKETWLGTIDRANEIEVTYFDKEDDYKQRTLKVYDGAALAAGRPQRSSQITLYGVVDYDRAYKEGMLQLNLNRYVLQTVEFAAPLEAIACSVGSLIYVQHDMPQWGYAGRFDGGSTASVVKLDRPVSMTAGKQYKLLALHDALLRASGSVLSVAGDSLLLTGFDGTKVVKRIKVAGRDLRVAGTFDQGGGAWGVIVDDPTGISAGQAYQLWDTDVIEERDVVNPGATDVTTLTLQSPLSQAPAQFVNWMFGEVGKVKKPFRIKSISGTHEDQRTITAIEYNASVYDLNGTAAPTPNYSALDAGVSQVTIESVEETLFKAGGGFRSRVTVFFSSAQESYARSTVYVSTNDGPYAKITDAAVDRASIEAEEGAVLKFKVVARDVAGASAPDSGAPTITHTVVGKLAPPSDVPSIEIARRPTSLLVSWGVVEDVDLLGYELRQGTSWDTARVLVTEYAGNSWPVEETSEGVHTFMVRAMDTGKRYSQVIRSASVELTAPAAVRGFDSVQNGSRIEFRWDPNAEPFVAGYEIREGATWNTATYITKVSATTYSMPANASAGTRTFWIKAIVEPGIYSKIAAFSTTSVAATSDRNVVIVDDEAALGWLGSKYQMSVVDGYLQLDAGKAYGEYTWGLGLPKTFRARNSINSEFGAVVSDAESWGTATYNWTNVQAARPWLIEGDLSAVDLRYYISKFVGLSPAYQEGFSLNMNTSGENGTVAAEAIGVSYGAGRFLKGARIGDFTRLNWTLAMPGESTVTFWVIPESLAGDKVFWSARASDGRQLLCGHDGDRGVFYLEDPLGRRVEVQFAVEVGDRVLIGIVQTATERKLLVGALTKSFASEAKPWGPVATTWQSVRLHA